MQITEANLKSQVTLYTEKYNEFKNALSKSHEIFGGFDVEMEKVTVLNVDHVAISRMWKI